MANVMLGKKPLACKNLNIAIGNRTSGKMVSITPFRNNHYFHIKVARMQKFDLLSADELKAFVRITAPKCISVINTYQKSLESTKSTLVQRSPMAAAFDDFLATLSGAKSSPKGLARSQPSTSTAANEYQAAARFFDESVVDGYR